MRQIIRNTKGDFVIWLVIFFLSMFSILAVYSSVGTLAYRLQDGNTEYYLVKHTILMVLGIGAIYLCHLIDFRYYSRLAQLLLYVSIPLLLITYFLGVDVNQAKRWLVVPGLDVTFQTSNVAKLGLVMFTARMLSKKQHIIKDFKRAFLPVMSAIFVICGLIAPADFSTAAILFTACFILLFVGRVNLKHLGLLVGSGVLALTLYIGVASLTGLDSRVGTWEERIESFNNEEHISYQNRQANIAIATGGVIGKGPGNSTQRSFLPNPFSDFIYAIIIEEWGITGGLFILFLYLVVLMRSLRIVLKSPRAFGAFLSLGLSLLLVLQALVNMGVAVHLIPVTGLNLPMVSMGGTSLLFTCFSFGIILSVSRYIEENEEDDGESESLTTRNVAAS
jgi:cell division protein FtsW